MSRLPVSGSDDGTWGDVLNDYLQVAHESDGTLKPDTVGAASIQDGSIGADKLDISGGSDGQVLAKDSGASGGLDWTDLPAAPRDWSSVYPLSAYGFFSASDNLCFFTTVSSLGSAFFARIFVPAGKAITAFGTIVASAGTVGAGGLNGFAVYSGTGTLVASTVSDDTLWQGSGWVTKALATPVAAQSSDRFVYASINVNGYSDNPDIHYQNNDSSLMAGGGYLVNNRRSFYEDNVTSWPASINPASYGQSPGGFLPLIALA